MGKNLFQGLCSRFILLICTTGCLFANDKTVEQLFAELDIACKNEVERKFHMVCKEKSLPCINNQKLCELTTTEIVAALDGARLLDQEGRLIRYLACVERAVELSGCIGEYGIYPVAKLRDVQRIALLCAMETQDGAFLEVQTGEGKSVVIAMLAAMQVLLYGYNVDITSSSSMLAQRDAIVASSFFEILGIRSGFISEEVGKKQACYTEYQILYSTLSELQADWLREIYLGLPTRRGRHFDAIIMDEVDSDLCDKVTHITKLSGSQPGHDHLMPIFAIICTLDEQFTKTLPPQPLEQKKALILSTMRSLLKSKITVPKHLKEYVADQLPIWVESLFVAKSLEIDNHYVTDNGYIYPVDPLHSGMVMKNVQWEDAVNRYVELLNAGYVGSEGCTSCFISTPTFLLKYQKAKYGFTGTLGDQYTCRFFQDVYNVGLVKIPTYKAKELTVSELTLCENSEEWLTRIVEEIHSIISVDRGVLVVSSTIADAQFLFNEFQARYPDTNCRLFTRSDKGEQIAQMDQLVNKAEVIFATNLAARGVNLLPAVEMPDSKMHICITFIPINLRSLLQIYGRGPRNGNKASAHCIVAQNQMMDHFGYCPQVCDIITLAFLRDLKEKERLEHLQKYILPDILLFDNLFSRVSKTFKNLRAQYKTSPVELKQWDELWGLQYAKLSKLDTRIYLDAPFATHINKYNLRSLPVIHHFTQNSLYCAISAFCLHLGSTLDPATLEELVLTHILSNTPMITEQSTAERWSANYTDTRWHTLHSPILHDLLNAICVVLKCSIVIFDQENNSTAIKHPDDSKPIIALSMYDTSKCFLPTDSVLVFKGLGLYDHRQDVIDAQSLLSLEYAPVLYAPLIICSYPDKTNQDIRGINEQLLTLISNGREIDQTSAGNVHTFSVFDLCAISDCANYSKYQERRAQLLTMLTDKFLDRLSHTIQVHKESQSTHTIFINPGYLCEYALCLHSLSASKGQPSSLALFDKVARSDKWFGLPAYYNKARMLVHGDRKKDAICALQTALQHTTAFQQQWLFLAMLHQAVWGNTLNSAFGMQMNAKIVFIDYLIKNIEHNIQLINAYLDQEGRIITIFGHSSKDFVSQIKGFNQYEVDCTHNMLLDRFFSVDFVLKPPDSWAYIGMTFLGIAQIMVGCLLFPAAPCISTTIITSGISDVWRVLRSTFQDTILTWDGYWMSKAITVATSLCCSIIKYIKEGIASTTQSVVSTTVECGTSNHLLLVKECAIAFAKQTIITEIAVMGVKKILDSNEGDLKDMVKKHLNNFFVVHRDLIELSIATAQIQQKAPMESYLIAWTREWVQTHMYIFKESLAKSIISASADTIHKLSGIVASCAQTAYDLKKVSDYLADLTQHLVGKLRALSRPLKQLLREGVEKWSIVPISIELFDQWYVELKSKCINDDSKFHCLSGWGCKFSPNGLLAYEISDMLDEVNSVIPRLSNPQAGELKSILVVSLRRCAEFLLNKQEYMQYIQTYLVHIITGAFRQQVSSKLADPLFRIGVKTAWDDVAVPLIQQCRAISSPNTYTPQAGVGEIIQRQQDAMYAGFLGLTPTQEE